MRSLGCIVLLFELRVAKPQAQPQPLLSTQLWLENEDIARRSLLHPWVLALGAGVLPQTSFSAYLAQDAFFLLAFARSYGRAISKCPSGSFALRCITTLHTLLDAVIQELELHDSHLAHATSEPVAATLAYTNFLDSVGVDESTTTLDILAAMAPCMSLYAYIGQALSREVDTDTPYGDWIQTYGSDDFAKAANDLELLLDGMRANLPDDGRAHELYAQAMQLEYDFFDAQMPAPEEHDRELETLRAKLLVPREPVGESAASSSEL